ncbi:MAG TPA: DNA-processing protein DprA [Intrasporangium sp.]|uniref:DNA-processing protein DprA n=1 Tax=Intrasporangium sp. TaxID=1925024 RepID=UPI002D78F942|nr:DNA-processing protein DprA [Intrasporangium sp.]HET7399280.1 DNA-processing protein DprA [Intrasporangium sp.]
MTDERRARAALSRLVEPCDATVAALLDRVGAVEAVERIRWAAKGLERFAARVERLDVDQDLANGARIGARVVIPGDDEWPARLDDLPIPPWCLWVRGPLELGAGLRRSVAVVGARICTPYGEHFAAELGAALAGRGWAVVSGAAFGIDAAAHRGCLAVDGTTVAVLAGGIDRVYPAAHGQLLQRILDRGACVSEVAPGSAPMKSRFLHRNRLIAALTAGTVVVEAGLRSGSLNTARHATALLRPVAAVPGPVTSMSSAGCHQHIRSGEAVLVTSAAEVIELVGDVGVDACEEPSGPVLAADHLPPAEAGVLEALPVRGSMDLDGLSVLTTLAPLAVRAALARLEDLGLAVAEEGRWRKARARRS